MAKKEPITMANWRVSIITIILFFGSFTTHFGSGINLNEIKVDSFKIILKELYNEDGIPAPIKSMRPKTIYLFKTNRNCLECYSSLEIYFKENFPNFKIVFIDFVPDNFLIIPGEIKKIKELVPSVSDIRFIFNENKEETENDILNNFSNRPSPFCIIMDRKKSIRYWDVNFINQIFNYDLLFK